MQRALLSHLRKKRAPYDAGPQTSMPGPLRLPACAEGEADRACRAGWTWGRRAAAGAPGGYFITLRAAPHAEHGQHDEDDRDHEEQEEQDLGDARRARGHAAEAERAGDEEMMAKMMAYFSMVSLR